MERMHIILRYLYKGLKRRKYKVYRSRDCCFRVKAREGIELEVRLARVNMPYLVNVVLYDRKDSKEDEKKIIKEALKIANIIDDLLSSLFQSSMKRKLKIFSRLGLGFSINLGLSALSLSPQSSEFYEVGEKIGRGAIAIITGLYTRLIIKGVD